MHLEAACGAEREVKVVKGNEALEGRPTAQAASEQRKKNGCTGTQKLLDASTPAPLPATFVSTP